VCEDNGQSEKVFPNLPIHKTEASVDSLTALLKTEKTVLLQYVGYGYSPSGSPKWLADALAHWKAEEPSRKLAVMFHETWATAKPWQRTFWQSGAQKQCVSRLLRLADLVVTSNDGNKSDLESLRANKSIEIIPIGPNMNLSSDAAKDWTQLLVFGQQATRVKALNRHQTLVKELVSNGLVKRIILAGKAAEPGREPAQELIRSWNLDVPLQSYYNFAPDKVPQEILHSGLAIVSTQSTFLLKSGVFQSIAQMGAIAITLKERDPGHPLVEDQHYLSYQADKIPALVEKLKDSEHLQNMSQATSELSRTFFSWENIARQWKDRLNDT
jgi:glycosyltransferase involved in cell wall biosynthesis